MPCKHPGQMRHPKTGEFLTYPCGQCLQCRLTKRSTWTLRNLLESRCAVSSSFWTLSLSDSGLATLRDRGAQTLFRRFSDALRKAEHRAGNPNPIRFYGLLEFGGQFGRPHYHFLIYNLLAEYRQPSAYQSGLPRPRLHFGCWPHGHIDVAEFNKATISYCCDYLTKFTDESSKPIPCRTIRPAIGGYGIRALAVTAARTHSPLPSLPAYLEIGGRKFPLDKFCRDTFERAYREAGGKLVPTNELRSRARVFDRLSWQAARSASPHLVDQEERNLQRMERLIIGKAHKKDLIERQATAIALNRAANKAATESVSLGFAGEE